MTACLRRACGRSLADHGAEEECPDGIGHFARRLRRTSTSFNEREVAVLIKLCAVVRAGSEERARRLARRYPREMAALERKGNAMQAYIHKLPVRT